MPRLDSHRAPSAVNSGLVVGVAPSTATGDVGLTGSSNQFALPVEVQRRLDAVALKELRDLRDTVQEVQRRVDAVEARNRQGQDYDLPKKGHSGKLSMSQIQEIQRLRLRFSTRQTENMLSHGVVVKY